MSKSKQILPALLTLAQAANVQTLLRKFETHYQIKSTKHKPLGREVLIDGEKYTILTRKISKIEDRNIYRSDVFVGNSREGTVASLAVLVVRAEDETVEEVTANITFDSLLSISREMFTYQHLGSLARQVPGYYVSPRSILLAAAKSTMSIDLQEPVLRVNSAGSEIAMYERYFQNKQLVETVSHQVIQNSAVWTTLKQHMVPDLVNPILDPTNPVFLTNGMLITVLGDLANSPLDELVINDDSQYHVVSGSTKAPGLVQPLDYEMHVFVTMVNQKQSALFRLTGVNMRFTLSAIMQIEPKDGKLVIDNNLYQGALKLMATIGRVPAMKPHEVGPMQQITMHNVYKGRSKAPTVTDYVPYEVDRQPFLLSHPSFTIFDAQLQHEPVFTSFLATPLGELLSIAAILTSNKINTAKETMVKVATVLRKHDAVSKTPVQTMAERMAEETRQRVIAEGGDPSVLIDNATGKPAPRADIQTGSYTESAACTSAATVDRYDISGSHQREQPEQENDNVDWAIPLLVGTKWPRSLRLDITTLQGEGRPFYLALLAPQFESFEKSIGYLAADYQEAGVKALIEIKKRDITMPYAIGFSVGEVVNMLELTFQRELKTARDTGDAHALELTGQSVVERIVQTYETIVSQFNQATQTGQVKQ